MQAKNLSLVPLEMFHHENLSHHVSRLDHHNHDEEVKEENKEAS